MKRLLIITLFFTGAIAMCKNKEASSETFNGVASLNNKTFSDLTVNGVANLNTVQACSLKVNGALNAEQCTIKQATVSGAANLQQCTINQKLTVHGGCNIKNSEVKNMTVYGGLNMKNSKSSDAIHVCGQAKLTESKIHEFESNGLKNEFHDCDISGSIVINKPDTNWFLSLFQSKTQQLTLIDTVVHGDITFEQDGGKVILHGSSKIHGKIIGGTIA